MEISKPLNIRTHLTEAQPGMRAAQATERCACVPELPLQITWGWRGPRKLGEHSHWSGVLQAPANTLVIRMLLSVCKGPSHQRRAWEGPDLPQKSMPKADEHTAQ